MAKLRQPTKKSKRPRVPQKTSKSALEPTLSPILEVIVEARVSPSGWSEETPAQLSSLLSKRFPLRTDIESRGAVGATSAARAIGVNQTLPHSPLLQLWNQERTELLQFGPDVLIAHGLKYSAWDAFVPTLREGADALLEVLKSARIDHLSFRIISRFDLGANKSGEVDLHKFFDLQVGLPKRFREVDGVQLCFQSHLERKKKSNNSVPIRLEVELRTSSAQRLTPLANGTDSASSSPTILLLDVDTSCACDNNNNNNNNRRMDEFLGIAEELQSAAMDALRSIVRPALVKKYSWLED